MNKILNGMLVVAGLMAMAPAMAATTWTFSDKSEGSSNGNTLTYSSSGMNVTASAWADTSNGSDGSNTVLNTAHLGSYGGGLGVRNRDNSNYRGDPGENSSPEHAMDNENRFDSILLKFDEAVSISSIGNGYYPNDSDMSILAYIGTSPSPTLLGKTYAGLVIDGWTHIGDLSDVRSGKSVSTSIYSSYWLIGAYNPVFDSSKTWTTGNDYMKLKTVVASVCMAGGASGGVCGGQPGTGVSEPGSLALAGLGLLGVIGLRRRQH